MAQQKWDDDLAAFIAYLEPRVSPSNRLIASEADKAGISPRQMWARIVVDAAWQTGFSPKELGHALRQNLKQEGIDNE